ncbi:MAG: FHA domain-containing protein [Acidobacteriota bacterium]|nr:FHA domain-containing protein [Acidobacteriota bacterium]
MITCERCHTENLDGSQYCDECGASLTSAARTKVPDSGLSGNASTPFKPTGNVVETSLNLGGTLFAGLAESSGANDLATPKPSFPSTNDLVPGQRPHAKLVIYRGRSVGKEFHLNDNEAHIGRWDADGGIFPDVDLDADDPEAKVSRRHARITCRSGQYYIEDLGSTNGTFINRGRRLLPGDRQEINDGDEVIVGKTFLRFHVVK